MRSLPYLLAAVLGLGASGLVACGSGDSSSALIRSADAGPLRDEFDAVSDAIAAHDCPTAAQAVRDAQAQVDSLPRATSDELVARLREGLQTLRSQAADECVEPIDTTTTETIPTETVPTETIPTETIPTETIPTETVPTETTPTTPIPTPDPGEAGGQEVPAQ